MNKDPTACWTFAISLKHGTGIPLSMSNYLTRYNFYVSRFGFCGSENDKKYPNRAYDFQEVEMGFSRELSASIHISNII